MQQETEREKHIAEFSKLRKPNESAYDYVRVVRTSKYGHSIIRGHNYGTEEMPDDWTDETITCDFPATAGMIFENLKSIRNTCNSGDIIKDIPFKSE